MNVGKTIDQANYSNPCVTGKPDYSYRRAILGITSDDVRMCNTWAEESPQFIMEQYLMLNPKKGEDLLNARVNLYKDLKRKNPSTISPYQFLIMEDFVLDLYRRYASFEAHKQLLDVLIKLDKDIDKGSEQA